MQSYFLAKSSILLQTVLLVGLLNGLLFSCGEGVRLLPFPNAETDYHSNSQWETNPDQVYEKNIHRFENQPTNSQAKSQKHLPDTGNLSKRLLLSESAAHQESFFSFQPNLSRSYLYSQNAGSRAPPGLNKLQTFLIVRFCLKT